MSANHLVVRARRGFDGDRVLAGGAAVLVEGSRIVGVEPAAAALPVGWPIVEFPEATVLPGLIDAHVHLCGDAGPNALERLPGFEDMHLGAVIDDALRRHLAAGVTTVRDLGDRRWAVVERRDTRAPGLPTVVASGPPITSVRGHCWHMGGEAAGAHQLRAAVRERVERRVDVIKVMASGGGMTPGTDVLQCQFTVDELRLVVEEAHAAGLPVTAHAHALKAVEQARAAGVDGIEHCSFATATGIRAPDVVIDALARQRVAVCPTLGQAAGVAPPPQMVAGLARVGLTPETLALARVPLLAKLYRHGVVLISGVDAGIAANKPHGILPRAVATLAACGVPAPAALASATAVAARGCGLAARKGRLHPGFDADLLIVDGDPLTNLVALERVAAVMVGGSWAVQPPATPEPGK